MKQSAGMQSSFAHPQHLVKFMGGHIVGYQIFLADTPSMPGRILEDGVLPAEEATEDNLLDLLQVRYRNKLYPSSSARGIKPYGIRVIDEENKEISRYTVIDLRRTGRAMSPHRGDSEE